MRRPIVGLAAAVLLIGLGPAKGAVILDQSYDPPVTGLYAHVNTQNNPVNWAQTFTVGVTGDLLRVDLKVLRSSAAVTYPLLFDVRTTSSGVPTEPNTGGNILSSLSISAGLIPTTEGFINVNLPSPVPVTIGDVLAIVLRSDQPGSPPSGLPAYWWAGRSSGDYLGGRAFVRTSGLWPDLPTTNDLAFKTFVDEEPQLIPEPSTLAIWSVVGALGITVGWWRRRR